MRLKLHAVIENITMLLLLFLMFSSLNLYFTWLVPLSLTYLLTLSSCLVFLVFWKIDLSKIQVQDFVLVGLLFLIYLYELLRIIPNNFLSYLSILCAFFISIFVMNATSLIQKKRVLNIISKATATIILISLVGWIFFLIGVDLPNSRVEVDNGEFYSYISYRLFLVNIPWGENTIPEIKRFTGFFLEPGHLGSTSSLLLYINKYDLKKWDNLVFLFGIIFSLSLAAYGLLIGGFLVYSFFNGNKKIKWIFFSFFIIGISYLISINYNKGNNVINNKIISRLEFNNGKMKGYNRTTALFEWKYKEYVNGNRVWLGMGRLAYGEVNGKKVNKNYTLASAGWKRYYLTRGIIGCFVILLFLTFYVLFNFSFIGFGFFILFVTANLIRDYPIKEYWLFLFLLALPLMNTSNIRIFYAKQ